MPAPAATTLASDTEKRSTSTSPISRREAHVLADELGEEWGPATTSPAETRRFNLVIAVAIVAIFGLVTAADFPPVTMNEWRDQWWQFGVYAAVVATQTGYRIRTGNARRRATSAVVEGSVLITMFWLSPWLVVTGRLLGALMGWMTAHVLTRRQRVFYFASHTIEVVTATWISQLVHSGPVMIGWRPLAVAGVVWVTAILSRIITSSAAHWIRTGRIGASDKPMHVEAAFVSLASIVFGLLGAMMIDLVWVGLFPTIAIAMMLTATSNSVRRAATMDKALDELIWLSTHASGETPAQIEHDLVQAVTKIRPSPTCAVVRPAPGNAVTWNGDVSHSMRQLVQTGAELTTLAALEAGEFVTRPSGVGSVGVWSIDGRTASMLVVESGRRPSQLRNYQEAINTLVASARLGILNARQLQDLEDQAEAERVRARTDATTGLPNLFAVTTAVDERLRDGVDRPLAAVVLSIDGLSEIVDVLGDDVGVAITNSFAIRLRRRAPDLVARTGTKNFVAIVDGGATEALACAATLTEVARTAVGHEVFTYHVSAGVAVCEPHQNLAAEELLRRADLALHDSRRRGETVVFGDAEAAYETRRATIRLRLSDAIAERLVKPAFQPQIDLRTGALAGVEVLARWNDPDLGFVSPGEFIEIAEQSRQVEVLTVSMLTQALDAATKWIDQGVAVPISVNLSAQSLMWPRFLQHLIDIVTSYDLTAELLTAEITESTLVEGPAVLDAIGQLRDLGARISIDDFGTGYSALSYMNTLPIHELKIDRSMVETIAIDRPSPILCRLIDLCADLNYSVVAEGIETEPQASVLAQMGCDIGQGYFFARPMMEEEMTAWMGEDHHFEFAPASTQSALGAEASVLSGETTKIQSSSG